MKVDISIPVDDIEVLRTALNDYYAVVSGAVSNTVGYRSHNRWKAKRDAVARIIDAIEKVAPRSQEAK